ASLAFVIGGLAMIGAPPLVAFPGHFFVELIAFSYSGSLGTALVASTLFVLIAQLRAAISIFRVAPERWRVERRPIAGISGVLVFLALLIGGVQPDGFLRPIAAFADEFIRALRPFYPSISQPCSASAVRSLSRSRQRQISFHSLDGSGVPSLTRCTTRPSGSHSRSMR